MQPWEACARTFLKQAIADLAAEGYALEAAFEPEFTLGQREPDPGGGPDRLVPADDSLCYSSTGFQRAHDFTMDLVQALEAQQSGGRALLPRAGPRPAGEWSSGTPRRCARPTTTCCTGRRSGAWRSGAGCGPASRPKPIPDQAGNGTHLHGSLFGLGPDGAPAGRNVFADAGDRYGLSETGYHFIGGLLAHLPALTALTCGSVNSYRRLAPQMWSSAYTVYGMDNREAAVRIALRAARRPGQLGQPRAEAVGLQRQPVPGPGRVHPRGPGRHPRQARSG